MDEVGGALIAIALVLVAVFVPSAFIGGITGQFFRQFALTIAVSTVISLLLFADPVSPALAALILKPHERRAARRPPGCSAARGSAWFTVGQPRLRPAGSRASRLRRGGSRPASRAVLVALRGPARAAPAGLLAHAARLHSGAGPGLPVIIGDELPGSASLRADDRDGAQDR